MENEQSQIEFSPAPKDKSELLQIVRRLFQCLSILHVEGGQPVQDRLP